ncbi:hypothetical protein TraAM80_10110 [Trypanosoma rangeli]|uniref:Uncharacterized protein n=1 Tax=Trypanosoma rangeli TaxID=5698 RepID=A0A3R7LEJ3_TRYRA|nr:uncharacterized protein TraAM80_10110 [Trypanosoma rangeli]RNE95738.1 hypothetical protein TraAM80_10110 [Trypanosoma rangeli]|eukprot:RNE95738.1 hypothetical protein TraAM80_10110 [Trypanosoma rangeli]
MQGSAAACAEGWRQASLQRLLMCVSLPFCLELPFASPVRFWLVVCDKVCSAAFWLRCCGCGSSAKVGAHGSVATALLVPAGTEKVDGARLLGLLLSVFFFVRHDWFPPPSHATVGRCRQTEAAASVWLLPAASCCVLLCAVARCRGRAGRPCGACRGAQQRLAMGRLRSF